MLNKVQYLKKANATRAIIIIDRSDHIIGGATDILPGLGATSNERMKITPISRRGKGSREAEGRLVVGRKPINMWSTLDWTSGRFTCQSSRNTYHLT